MSLTKNIMEKYQKKLLEEFEMTSWRHPGGTWKEYLKESRKKFQWKFKKLLLEVHRMKFLDESQKEFLKKCLKVYRKKAIPGGIPREVSPRIYSCKNFGPFYLVAHLVDS